MATRVKRKPRPATTAPAAVAGTETAVDLEAAAGLPAPAYSPAATDALGGEDALTAVVESPAATAALGGEDALAAVMESPAATAALGGEDAFAAVMESQAAMARGFAEASAEMAGLAKTGIDAAARTANDMLAVKTLADAIELSAGFAYRSFDTLVAGSAKLSEISLRAAAEAAHPLLARFGRDWAAVR